MLVTGRVFKHVAELALESGMGSAMKKTERMNDRISERECQVRLKNLQKSNVNARLEPLKSLRTATKKRRELKTRS